MDPCAVSNMQYCGDLEEMEEIYGTLKLDKADLIILPINDNSNPQNLSNEYNWF